MAYGFHPGMEWTKGFKKLDPYTKEETRKGRVYEQYKLSERKFNEKELDFSRCVVKRKRKISK